MLGRNADPAPEDTMARQQIFISHISSEGDIAERLKQRLASDFLGMLDIFVSSDRSSIQAGTKWLDEVDKALKAADAEIVLCSRESVGRPWIHFEAGAAWLRGIPVIPVCHSGLALTELPVPLSMLQGLECSRPEGLQKLYDTVAKLLGAQTPAVDFAALAADLRQLEDQHRAKVSAVPRIESPRVLCAASAQYAEPAMGFELDVGVLQSAFGAGQVTIERSLTRKRLTELLTQQRFDIVHLVLAVDSKSGDLIFSPIDLATYQPSTARIDKLAPEGLVSLLGASQTALVVLATCKALRLAVEVARCTNMVGTEEEITGEQAAEWADCFYDLLRQGQPLYKAFELTQTQVEVPMLPVRHHDVAFGLPPR
jgi:hypothetical protein